MNRTKIICTAGPSVDSDEKLEALARQGMSLLRINCSHGNVASRLKYIHRVRRIEKKVGVPIGVILDLQGPRLRIGQLPQPFLLHENEVWEISSKKKADEKKRVIPIPFKKFSNSVKINGTIYMDDGLIRTRVIRKNHDSVWIKVLYGGFLSSAKGINIPYEQGHFPILNDKDKQDLLWGLNHHVDYVALSFIRSADDIRTVKNFIHKQKPETKPLVIAKIEKPEAVQHMVEIIVVSDCILVARGDLGIELALEKVPVVQKQLIEMCRTQKKPVIIATQMLDSMRAHPIPTRAEVSDVASAIYAGADALLLTGETSSGKYPVQATTMLSKIISEVEHHLFYKTFRKKPEDFGLDSYQESFLFNAMQLASDVDAKAIVVLTRRGEMTQTLSKLHPRQPVFSLAGSLSLYRKFSLYWGVFPIEIPRRRIIEGRIEEGLEILRAKKVIKKGDRLIFMFRDFQSENLNLKIVEC